MAAVGAAQPLPGWRAWWLAARPRTLPLAAAPVAVGTALAFAEGDARPLPALAALAGALSLQVGANFANDLFDAQKGADGHDRIGPPRAVQMGWITPSGMRRGMAVALGAAGCVGLYLVALAGWPILAAGALSLLAAVAYTGGPFPLGYHGLGDLAVLVFFGLVAVCGSYYVQTLSLSPAAVAASLPVGSLATAVLVVNNVRDVESDARAGKRTLAVRWGRGAGIAEYAALLGLAQLAPLGLYAAGLASPWVLLPLLTLPRAWGLLETLRSARDGATSNACLAATAQLALVHALLFALGLCL